jgi:hypothetical protein
MDVVEDDRTAAAPEVAPPGDCVVAESATPPGSVAGDRYWKLLIHKAMGSLAAGSRARCCGGSVQLAASSASA